MSILSENMQYPLNLLKLPASQDQNKHVKQFIYGSYRTHASPSCH